MSQRHRVSTSQRVKSTVSQRHSVRVKYSESET